MKRNFTCIICPNGCEMTAEYEGSTVLSVSGNLCPKGAAYATQELTDPRRTIATSIRVIGGTLPLVSVRLTKAIHKTQIFEAMQKINQCELNAPVHIGDVVLHHLFGTDCDVIVTKNVPKAE